MVYEYSCKDYEKRLKIMRIITLEKRMSKANMNKVSKILNIHSKSFTLQSYV